MSPTHHIRKTFQRMRITRHRVYKRAGVFRHRKKLDIALRYVLAFLLIMVFLLIFHSKPATKLVEYPVPDGGLTQIDSDAEQVHEPFDEDEPVVPDEEPEPAQASLTDLEKKATAGAVTLKTLSLEPKESLFQILKDAKINVQDRQAIADSLGIVMNLKTLKPGQKFYVFTDKANNDFLGLSLHLKNADTVAVLKEKDGTFTPITAEGRIETLTERVSGTIERTFAGSAKKAGLPDSITAQVTGALDGEIDFVSDIKPGQKFEIIYERKVTQKSKMEIGEKTLLFIGLDVGKNGIYRYAWTDGGKISTFYDARGISAPMTLYKRPVKARTRLTSGYGNRRHPILLYEVFHTGVDLAAPLNTPVMAAGDGIITQLGRKGAYGKYVRIRHPGGYETAYGHLNGYRGDLKVGSVVKRGETIAYLGNTGRSTGPHVHFEVIKDNKTVNPFGTNVIAQKQLVGFELEQFQSYAEQLHPDFNRHLAGPIPPVPAKKPDTISGVK